MLLGSSFVGALLLGELVLRAAGIAFPIFSRPDDERGWALRPGARGRFEAEGGSWVVINRDGLRDREHSRTKPPGTLRIAVLGDSYAEALQVPVEQTFWSVLEGNLNRSGSEHGWQVEVLNFGVRGYGTAQELLTLRCCVWDYSPDIVLLAFVSGNDLSDNSPTLDRNPTRFVRPYFRLTPAGWRPDRSYLGSWRHRTGKLVAPFVAYSRILQLANRAQNVLLRRRRTGSPAPTGERQIDREIGLDARSYVEPEDEAWKDAWRTTEELVAVMAREASERGARFAVVSVANPIQVYPDSTIRQRFARQLGVSDLLLPGRRIRAVGDRTGFPVLDLAPELQRYADRHRSFMHGSPNTAPGVGHWNPLGHRLAGEQIASWLAGWIADPHRSAPGR